MIYYVHGGNKVTIVTKLLLSQSYKCDKITKSLNSKITKLLNYYVHRGFKSHRGCRRGCRLAYVRGRVFSALFHDYTSLGRVFTNVKGALSDVRGSVFLDVAIHAYVAFSMGLQRLVMGFVRVKGLFYGLFVSLAIVKLFGVGYRLLFSTYNDVIVFLYGMVRHGSK